MHSSTAIAPLEPFVTADDAGYPGVAIGCLKRRAAELYSLAEAYMRLPQTWLPVLPDEAARLQAELHRELPPSHQLYRHELIAVARREKRDDVLFQSPSGAGQVFWVHLTRAVESDPRWPSTEIYQDMDDFLERWPREELE